MTPYRTNERPAQTALVRFPRASVLRLLARALLPKRTRHFGTYDWTVCDCLICWGRFQQWKLRVERSRRTIVEDGRPP